MAAKTATRQLILEAVIACIEKYGIDKLTTRKIALEAGTNIASINYHFRSKDELVAEALSMTIQHMMQDVFIAIDDREQPFESALANVFFYLLNGSRLFPGVTRAHLYRAAVQRDDDSISAQAMRRVFDRLCQRSMQEFPSVDPHKIRFIVSGIMSTIMFSLLAPGFFPIPREYQPISPKKAHSVADLYARQVVSALQ